ncbi:MAG: hypothetical protein ACFCVK_04700 [Acidimicrobiales bacterium]
MTLSDAMLPSSTSEFGQHLREMALRWKVLASITLLVGLGVFLVRLNSPEVYQSTAVLQVKLPDRIIDDGKTTEFRTKSLAELASVPSVIGAAGRSAGIEGSVEDIGDRIDVGVRDTPGFLEVNATGPVPGDATRLAQAMADRLAMVGTTDEQGVTAEVIVDASDADEPRSPRPVGIGVLAAMVTLLIAGESVVVVRKLQGWLSPVDTTAEVQRMIGVPALDLRLEGSTSGSPLPFFASHLADREVITVLQVGGHATADPAAIVASTAAMVKEQVLLVDMDLFDPALHEVFGHPRAPGLAEVLSGQGSLRQVAKRASAANPVAVVSAGAFQSELLGPARVVAIHRLINASASDHTVLSVTARSSLFDALVVASRFGDAVVLAVDPLVVKAATIRSVAAQIGSLGGRLAAILLYSETARVPAPSPGSRRLQPTVRSEPIQDIA